MTRLLILADVAATFVFVIGLSARAETPSETPWAWPAEVAPELKRIQQELGGSIVRGMPADRSAGATWVSDADGKSREARLRVEALREAAADLDKMANLLEPLELYSQADALREQAQRLRVDARDFAAAGFGPSGTVAPSSTAPSLDVGPVPMQERPATGAFHAPPLFAPEEGRRPMPENARPDVREGRDLPQLEPVAGGERPQTDELQPVPTPGAPRVGDEELTPAPLSE